MNMIFGICVIFISAVIPNLIAMEYLNNGEYKIPVLGLGTFLANNKSQLTNALNVALELGYRHIDTASLYGNENVIGDVLKEWISLGKVKREELFITTKLRPDQLTPENIESAIKASLENLKLDYLDLYLLHNPMRWNVFDKILTIVVEDHIQIWKKNKKKYIDIFLDVDAQINEKMEEQVDAGRTRTIGLSNFNISQIERIQKFARIQPTNIQIECHVYFQQRELREFANKNNLTVVAYAPLGTPGIGQLVKPGEPNFVSPNMLGDEKIKKIADKHHKSVAQIAIKFLVQSGMATIPKSSNPKRIKENFEIFDFTLNEDDIKILESLDRGKNGRIFNYKDVNPTLLTHPQYPFHDL